MLTDSNTSLPQPSRDDAWATLDYEFSITGIQRLGWLHDRIAATVLLADRGLFTNPLDAKRLVFARWLFTSRRLSEHVIERLPSGEHAWLRREG